MLVGPPSGKKVLWQEMLRQELLAALDVYTAAMYEAMDGSRAAIDQGGVPAGETARLRASVGTCTTCHARERLRGERA